VNEARPKEAATDSGRSAHEDRAIVLVGLMGSGKSTVGARLAAMLKRRFVDADAEIEAAANMTVSEIFARYGEAEFRSLERRVIARLLAEKSIVIASGGGAFMDPVTRALMQGRATSIWLRADLDVLMKRVGKRGGRPLLEVADPRAAMAELMAERYPVYAEADLVIDSEDGPHDVTVRRVLEALEAWLLESPAADALGSAPP
jgi:shikimate kinase